MRSQWVDFSALKGSVDIEPVLAHYRVRLKRVRKDYLRGFCPLPTHGSPQGPGKAFAATSPQKKCGLVIRLPVIRHARAKWVGIFWTWWRVWRTARFARRPCGWREAGERHVEGNRTSRSTGFKRKEGWPQRGTLRGCRLLYGEWHPYLDRRGFSGNRSLVRGRLLCGSGFLRGRIVFPIHDSEGRLVAYAGRSIEGPEPRYLFPPGFRQSRVVLNLHRRPSRRPDRGARSCEGFFDCLRVHQAGYDKVVALMGASVSDRQAECAGAHIFESW